MFGRWVVTFMALSIRTAAGLVNLPVRRRIIAQSDMASHMAAMSLRPLFAILVAICMFVAPLAIRSGAAMAMPQPDHHGQMMKAEHCGEQQPTGKHGKSGEDSCCVAMCMAVAPAPAAQLETHFFATSVDRPGLDRFGRSFLAELPTPPPRLA